MSDNQFQKDLREVSDEPVLLSASTAICIGHEGRINNDGRLVAFSRTTVPMAAELTVLSPCADSR
jgi:hypothetical protein